jgi:hypothetical protein
MLGRMTDLHRWAEVLGPPTSKAQVQARQRQQASQARFDHALEVVDQATAAVSAGDLVRLDRLVSSLDALAFDDFEQHHPGHAAVDFALYDVIGDLCELVEDDEEASFGQTWIDQLVAHADRELPAGAAGWVRLAVGFAADEYRLSNQELEAIDRLRGELRPDRDTTLVGYLAGRDQRPPVQHLRDGIHALAWLRDHP